MTNTQGIKRGDVAQSKGWITGITVVLILAVLALCFAGWKAGIFTSTDTLNAFLSRMGIWAPIVFVLIQITQIIVPVIPAAITCTVGVLVFGPVNGFLLNYGSIVAGSFLAFLLARRYGHALIRAVVSPRVYGKYVGWLDKEQAKFDKLFGLCVFLPFSPDDLLCMLAGVSKMRAAKFVVMLVLLKPAFLLPYSLGISSLTALLGG